MLSVFIVSLLFILGVFSLINFKFIVMLLMVENINVALLLFSYFSCIGGSRAVFLVFIVVATIEVTISLVCLTRLWDTDLLLF
uniref:NADH dehydrogenase subunit 4L n=1 Tax=Dactylogyrus lamellatus TaxID=231327 RepID=A0A342K3V3_9PLAT|nr:NADH dehydrogenase subunit 4L [Dactylogyrus lamellatus]ALP29097.1 NADH dehydrogenase subunit 4L [Dactylogyrus lamellatus]